MSDLGQDESASIVLPTPTEAADPVARGASNVDEQASAAAEAAVEGRWAAGQPSSPYEGVCWVKQRRLWKAYIYNKGGQVLGHFVEEKVRPMKVETTRKEA